MHETLLGSFAALLLVTTATVQAEDQFPAKLKSRAVLPAQSFIDPPADAPDDLKNAGVASGNVSINGTDVS